MSPVGAIALWSLSFIGSHLVISSPWVRRRLVARIGELPYRVVYSIVAFATLTALIITFAHHKHSGTLIWYLRDIAPIRWLVWLTMLSALILLVAGLINPSPSTLGASPNAAAAGVLKLTRHPSFVAFIMFGVAHMLMNGWAGDLIFFGTFPVLSIIGGMHQDRRKQDELGDRYRQFVARTSFVPGAALWSGREHWTAADMPWAAIAIGVVATILIVLAHPYLFGGSPIG
ncbi:MAG: hypothetical protein IVW54_11720 [Candidatus Binataceae bacterium]|nr:hypothetical protein [Candidatus Binataceae bacterium]